jgi:hypothetical protein
MLAAVVVLLDSVDSAAAVAVLVAVVPVPVPHEPELPALAPPVLAGLPVLAHLVVDSAVLLDLLNRQSFSAAMARSSP